jgi:transposase-like protein
MPGRSSRWTSEEKIRIVMESMNTNISLAELCRKYNLNPGVFRYWKDKFIQAGKLGLTGSVITDPLKDKEAEINRLKKLIGELTIANEAMKEVLRGEGKK